MGYHERVDLESIAAARETRRLRRAARVGWFQRVRCARCGRRVLVRRAQVVTGEGWVCGPARRGR